MKKVYEPIVSWLRFHADVLTEEIRLCNERAVVPLAGISIGPDRGSEVVMARLEEIASAMWLMSGEQQALRERLRELRDRPGGDRLPAQVRALFERPRDPDQALPFVAASLRCRTALIGEYAREVDPHTRLVLTRHVVLVDHLIAPMIDAAAGTAGTAEEVEPLYRAAAPRRRDHPDSFLALSRTAG